MTIREISVIRGLKAAALIAVLALAGCVTSPEPQEEPTKPLPPAPPTLSATVSSVTLSDVPIGAPVALRLPNGGYYALRNDSHARLKARIAPMVPTYCQRLANTPVYSPVTNMSWVTVEPRTFDIPPHSESEAMVIVLLPDDPSLLCKHLEFWIRAEAMENVMASVALYSRIRLDVAKERPAELERVRARGPESRKLNEKK